MISSGTILQHDAGVARRAVVVVRECRQLEAIVNRVAAKLVRAGADGVRAQFRACASWNHGQHQLNRERAEACLRTKRAV